MRRKKTISVYKTGTYQKRGTSRKSITFPHGKKSIDKLVRTLQNLDFKTFDYLRRKNKPGGKHYKPPAGITVIFEVTKRKRKYTSVHLSHPEFVVNAKSIKDFTLKTFNDLLFNWEYTKNLIDDGDIEDSELDASSDPENLDPRYLTAVAINFFYGQ